MRRRARTASRRPTIPAAPEAAEQRALAGWLDSRRVLWCHVPNGGARSGRTGALLKRDGVKPGVPDVLIFTPPPDPPRDEVVGVALELKRTKGGSVSAEQTAWLNNLAALGWFVIVAKGATDAVRQLMDLGY